MKDRHEIDYNIGDIDIVVGLLARLVGSTVEYIRELIDNSLDSIWTAENQRSNYVITVTIDRRRNRITVSDNAHGMKRSRIEQIPSEIGGGKEGKLQLALAAHGDTSRKGRIAKLRGINQVGIHGWEAVGRMCTIHSRSDQTEGETHTLIMGFGSNDRKFKPEVGQEEKNRSSVGTDVEISDIDPKTMSRVNIKRLIDFLAQEYRKDLLERQPTITIEIEEIDRHGNRKERRYVAPVIVKTNEFFLNDGSQQKFVRWSAGGKNFLEAVTFTGGALPNLKDGRVRIWWGRRRIYNDITEIEGFDHAPWNSGRLDMDIQADFCKTGPKKSHDLIDDPEERFAHFKKALRELEKPLSEFLATMDTTVKSDQDNVSKEMRKLVVEAFADLGYELEGVPVRRRAKIGGDEEINTGIVPGVRTKPNVNGTKPSKVNSGRSIDLIGLVHGADQTRKVDHTKPKKTASRMPAFDFFTRDMGDNPCRGEVTTDEGGRLVSVIINSAHPDYKRFVEGSPNSIEARRYRVDQLVNCLFIFHLGEAVKPEEITSQVDDLRYRVYAKGGLFLKR